MKTCAIILGFIMSLFIGATAYADESDNSVYDAYMDFASLVQGGTVTPNWMPDGNKFWIVEGGPQNREILVIDPAANSKQPLFDVARLRVALTEASGYEPAGKGVPFAQLAFLGPDQIQFTLEGQSWRLDLNSYELSKQDAPSSFSFIPFLVSEAERGAPKSYVKPGLFGLGDMLAYEAVSPDFKWFASTQDGNVAIRASVDGRSVMLTEDGEQDFYYNVESAMWNPWSPSGEKLIVPKVDTRGMARISTIKWLKPLEETVDDIITIPAGGKLNRDELFVVDVFGGNPVQIDLGDTTDHYIRPLVWLPDSNRFVLARYDRLLTRVEIILADATRGEIDILMTEQSGTFLTNQHEAIWATNTGFDLLADGSGFIYRSQRDGWAHLYLYDIDGKLQRQLTKGEFPVQNIVKIDQATGDHGGWVYFQAHGDSERPYDNHLYRVGLDGKGFEQLTEGKGRHAVQFSPSGQFFTDSFSSVDTPPKTVLRGADGELVRTLGEADISRLERVGWVPPREYVVKAADGETDIWVTMFFPYDFDAGNKYPVIEYIYAGPQTTMRTMDFPLPTGDLAAMGNFNRALANLGFIVLTTDGRGTPGRSKAFHDVVYKNWGQFEINDHAGAIRQLGERHAFMDLDRVGVMGGSWGGHFTFRALTQAPDLYKVGIAEVPGYDSRAFTLYEVYLGMPQDNKALYDAADALPLAPLLKGKLLMTGGLNDTGTQKDYYKMSEALIRLGIQHDTMTYPNSGHGFFGKSGAYNLVLKKNYFIEHL